MTAYYNWYANNKLNEACNTVVVQEEMTTEIRQVRNGVVYIYYINAGSVCVWVCVSVRPREISGTERRIAALLSPA